MGKTNSASISSKAQGKKKKKKRYQRLDVKTAAFSGIDHRALGISLSHFPEESATPCLLKLGVAI